MATDTRYPILVDTDTLIAVANSSLWTQITKHVGLTTTNVFDILPALKREDSHVGIF